MTDMTDTEMLLLFVILIVALIVTIIIAIASSRASKKKFDAEWQRHQDDVKQYQQTQQQFTAFRQEVEAEAEEKRETSRRRYVTKKLKEQILARDNTTCQICGISKQVFDAYAEGLGDYLLLEIDHIKPVASGGRGDDANNLQVLCWRCNRKKTNKRTNNEVSAMIDYGIKYLPLINMDMKGGDNNDSKTNAKA